MGSRNFAMAGISFPQEVGRETSSSLSFARLTIQSSKCKFRSGWYQICCERFKPVIRINSPGSLSDLITM